MINKLIEPFLPHSLNSGVAPFDYQKTSLIIFYDLLAILTCLTFFFIGILPEVFLPTFNYIIIVSAISLGMIRFSDLLKISFINQARFQTLAIALALCTFVIQHEVTFSGTPLWFSSSLIMAVFLVNLRWALFIAFLFFSSIIYSYLFYFDNGAGVPRYWSENSWLINILIDQTFSLGFNLMILSYFFYSKERAEQNLLKSQELVLRQQETIFENSRMAELGQISGGVAHEINNPLAIIQGNIQQGLRETRQEFPDMSRLTRNLQKIEAQSNRIQLIIKSLLHFSQRIDEGSFQAVSPAYLYEEIKEYYADTIIKDEIIILFHNEGPENDKIYCKHAQIFQALCHLINNAIDSISELEEKEIIFLCERTHTHQILSIIDNGPGISRDIEHKVTSPFFTTKPVGEGAGLGLSVVEGIMKAHNGDLVIKRDRFNSQVALRFPLNGH
jgi:signal transduction histidine kinase